MLGSELLDVHKQVAQRGRWGIATFFVVNGFITGSWAVQIPQLIIRFGISERTIGLLILMFGFGMVLMIPFAGLLMTKYGSSTVSKTFAIATCFALIPLGIAPNIPILMVSVFMLGAIIGGIDVAMNSNAVIVERALSKSILSSCHAFWSLGVFVAGSIGGIIINKFGFFNHILIVSFIAIFAIILAWAHILVDSSTPKTERNILSQFPRSKAIYLIGIVALFGMIPERAVVEWSTIYLLQLPNSSLESASLALAFFAGGMAIMRFAGDAMRNRFGAVLTLRLSALIAAIGIAIGALAPSSWLAIFGFAFSGIGIANIVPIAFSAAGNQNGITPSIGISIVTAMGYSGTLLAPALIGSTVEVLGFSVVYLLLSIMLAIVFVLAPLVKTLETRI